MFCASAKKSRTFLGCSLYEQPGRAYRLTESGVFERTRSYTEQIEFHTDRLHATVNLTEVWK